MAQTLIDADIILLYLKGSDSDRKTLDKVYPMLKGVEEQLMIGLFQKHLQNPGITYPIILNGKTVNFKIVSTERP